MPRLPPHITPLICLLLLAAGPAAAQLRVVPVDARTGQPGAARLQLWDAGGELFGQPNPGHRAHWHHRLGGYVHADGAVELDVAKGPVRILASRGLTSVPLDTTFLFLGPTTVELPLHDWVDPAAHGWYGADPHVHGDHPAGADYAPATEAQAASAARAEGLDLLFLLDNLGWRAGGPVLPPHAGVTLAHGEEYRSDYWGHVVLLGLDELVLGQGYAGCCGSDRSPWPTLHETLRQRPPSLALIAHPVSSRDPRVPHRWPGTGVARELPALALGGEVGGMAVGSGSNVDRWAVPLYLDALWAGARWAAIAEGDVVLDRHEVAPPGAMRSYAHVPWGHGGPGDPALAARWQEAVARAASFATTGPVFTRLELAGSGPGETVEGAGPLQLSIGLRSYGAIDSLVLHGPDGVQRHLSWPAGRSQLDTTITLEPVHDGFVVVEASGPGHDWPGLVHEPRAVSSPIWFRAGASPQPPAAVARRHVAGLVELADAVTHHRDFASEAESLATMLYLRGAAARWEQLVDDPPPPFGLLAPANGQEMGSLGFALDWESPPSLDGESLYYRVRVGADPGLLAPVRDFLVARPPAMVSGLAPGADWYWSVWAIEMGEVPVAAHDGPRHFHIAADAVDAPAVATGLACRARWAQGAVQVELELPAAGDVQLRLYDARGRRVLSRELPGLEGGHHALQLLATDHAGRSLARGRYRLLARLGPWHATTAVDLR